MGVKNRNMTLRGLISKLQEIEDEVGPRAPVVIELAECREVNTDFSHFQLTRCEADHIAWRVDDSLLRADGTERTRNVVVLAI